jgi:signal transduction histidine kinase/AmiR/NasT family two-component response regulator
VFGVLFDRRSNDALGLFALGRALFVVDGFVWGLTGWMMYASNDFGGIAVLTASLVGVATISVFKIQSDWRTSLGFSLPLVGLPIVFFALRADAFGVYGAASLATYALFLASGVRQAERRTVELLTLRFTNAELTRALSTALDEANRESQAKDIFLANMSHELRTPLHGILGLSRMLMHSVSPSDRNTVGLLRRSGEHLLGLINNVLEFSRFQAHGIDIDAQEVDVASTIDDAIALCRPGAAERRILLEERVELRLPCVAKLDPFRLRQVLLNLIGNAVKFTDAGGSIRVVVREVDAGRTLQLAVSDTGIGMSAATLSKLFEPFAQGDMSNTRRHGGTGLGLNITRAICHQMGGDVSCQSTLGRGSTFTVALPLRRMPEKEAALARGVRLESADFDEPFDDTSGRTVLLAEDNEVNALVGTQALQRMGLDVIQATTGAAVVERTCTNGHRPDLVLLDCQMPVMDGYEAARQIRAYERRHGLPSVPLVALTANVFQSDRDRCREVGMDAFLSKPFGDEQLRSVLELFRILPRQSEQTDSSYAALLL